MAATTLTPLDNPPRINAQELHELLVTSYANGNVAQKRCIDALRALAESRLYLQLGFRDIAGYADATLHLQRTQTFEWLRVSRRLVDLPLLAAAFESGAISFSLTSTLTRVATAETQSEWLKFRDGRPTRAVVAELNDALRKGRHRPRGAGFGLPGLPVKITFELSPEEHGILDRGLAKVASEMEPSLDGARPSPKEALLYLLHRVLATESGQSVTAGRTELSNSPWTMVLHRCPDCLRGALETEDGRVEIEEAVLDRIEGGAEHVVISDNDAASRSMAPEERDRPNSPLLRRALLHREGGRCANPFCRRETGNEGHGHHIQFRSRGGRTNLRNEIWTCPCCHSLLHNGSLRIEGDSFRGLRWIPAVADTTRRVRAELAETISVPQARLIESRVESGVPDSANAGSFSEPAAEDASRALVKLGCSRLDAEKRMDAARARFRLAEVDPRSMGTEGWLREALRA